MLTDMCLGILGIVFHHNIAIFLYIDNQQMMALSISQLMLLVD